MMIDGVITVVVIKLLFSYKHNWKQYWCHCFAFLSAVKRVLLSSILLSSSVRCFCN